MRLARTAAPLLRIENSAAKRLPRRSRGRGSASADSRPLRRDLAGWSRTSGLRYPKPAGWPASLQPDATSTTVESNHAYPLHQSGACPAGPSSSPRRSRRLQGSAAPQAGIRAAGSARRIAPAKRVRRRQGIAPCSTGSRPAGSLLALRRSLAGRSRTSVGQGRSLVLIR
jgi:hypothetical protein